MIHKEAEKAQKKIKELRKMVFEILEKIKLFDDPKGWSIERKIDAQSYFKKVIEDLKINVENLNEEINQLKSNAVLLQQGYRKKENVLGIKEKQLDETTAEAKNKEWENIANTLAHTLKGPNNIIINKCKEIVETSIENISELQNIIGEAEYSNRIISLFDQIRQDKTLKKTWCNFNDFIRMIRLSENRCFNLARYDASEIHITSLERIAGSIFPDDLDSQIKFQSSISLVKEDLWHNFIEYEFYINEIALQAIFDEIVLNMYRYAQSPAERNEFKEKNLLDTKEEIKLFSDKPKIFELFITQKNNDFSFSFINSSLDPLYKHLDFISDKNEGGLTKKSFGIYFMTLFSKKSPKSNLSFFDLDIPIIKDVSQVTLTFKGRKCL